MGPIVGPVHGRGSTSRGRAPSGELFKRVGIIAAIPLVGWLAIATLTSVGNAAGEHDPPVSTPRPGPTTAAQLAVQALLQQELAVADALAAHHKPPVVSMGDVPTTHARGPELVRLARPFLGAKASEYNAAAACLLWTDPRAWAVDPTLAAQAATALQNSQLPPSREGPQPDGYYGQATQYCAQLALEVGGGQHTQAMKFVVYYGAPPA